MMSADEVRELLKLIDAGLSTDGVRVLLALWDLLEGENRHDSEWVNVISDVSPKRLAARAGIAPEALEGVLEALEACGQVERLRLSGEEEDAYELPWPTEDEIIEQHWRMRRKREEWEEERRREREGL